MVRICNCAHEQQDGIYGKGQRLHNGCKPNGKTYTHDRCTVCGSEKARKVKEKKEETKVNKKGK